MGCTGQRTTALGRAAATLWVVLSVAVLAVAGVALASDAEVRFHLVVHPENAVGSVDRQFLADVFLKKAIRWPDGEAIEPVDLRFGAPVRESFSRRVLRRSAAAIRSYWQQRIFTGRGVPPPELESDEAVLRYVRTHRGGVGYVSEAAAVTSANVISVH